MLLVDHSDSQNWCIYLFIDCGHNRALKELNWTMMSLILDVMYFWKMIFFRKKLNLSEKITQIEHTFAGTFYCSNYLFFIIIVKILCNGTC